MDIHIWISIYGYQYTDIHIWISIYGSLYGYPYMISIYGYPYMGSQGSLGWDTLGWDTLGGPMGPWDRWDLGTDGTWASRTPDHKTDSRYFLQGYFIDTRPGPAWPAPPPPPQAAGATSRSSVAPAPSSRYRPDDPTRPTRLRFLDQNIKILLFVLRREFPTTDV